MFMLKRRSFILGSAVLLACSASNHSDQLASGTGASAGSGNSSGAGAAGGVGGGSSGSGGLILGGAAGVGGSMGGSGGMIDVAGHSTPSMIDECTSNTDGATLAALRAGGSATGGKWLYPFDGTVWPRGLLAPTLQWEQSGSPDAIYLKLQSKDFLYEGCFAGASAPLQLPIPQTPWTGAGEWSEGPSDPLMVTLTTRSGGTITTLTEQWIFALATLKGAIYYNTYTSPLANLNGAVMKIVPGQATPVPFLQYTAGPTIPLSGPCYSCHSLSANGMFMTANQHTYPGGPFISESYNVSANSPALVKSPIPEAGFAALYPDGTKLVTNGPPSSSANGLFPNGPGNIPALVGPGESKLLDAATATQLGAGPATHAQMPMFSPDGKMIVYNDYDAGQGHALFVADFDNNTNTFTNQREIFRDSTRYPGWPFFTPDDQSVVFALGTRADYVSQLPNPLTVFPADATGRSKLEIVYLASPGQGRALDAANGYLPNNQSYLPAGAARDNDLEFFPTVSPVAAGGYFWVFFSSRRTYGNMWVKDLEAPESKKIWATAITIGGTPDLDVSHPAFVLPGQEIESGNIRAFAALEPCKEDGSACTSGTECCKGFCVDGVCQMPQSCANIDDKCTTAADCCDSSAECFGGFCAVVIR